MRFNGFNDHHKLEGLHATFTPSQSHWLRYDEAKALEVYSNKKAAEMGTKLHQWAQETIKLGIKQPRSKKTIYAYVNDAIGYRMDTEVVLFYSEYFFGTTDSISFRDNFLRIHDLKTGITPAKMEQLIVYAALFCLEYRIDPRAIEVELRIYQNDEILIHATGDVEVSGKDLVEEIIEAMDQIIFLDKVLAKQENKEV